MQAQVTQSLVKRAFSKLSNGFSADLQSRNWSVYAQWLGVLCIFLNIILGVVNLLHLGLIVIFGIIAIVQALLIFFLEIPLFLKLCPVTERFVSFIRYFQNNLLRAGLYIAMAAIQYGGLALQVTSLLACAIVMTVTSICYLLGHLRKQQFVTSATLGGPAVPPESLA